MGSILLPIRSYNACKQSCHHDYKPPYMIAKLSVLEEIVEVVDFRGQCHKKSGHCGCEGSSGDITEDGTLLWLMTVRNQH